MFSRWHRITLLASLVLLLGQGCLSVTDNTATQTAGPAGIFVSTDGGENWKAISTLPGAEGNKSLTSVSVYRLVEDPQDPNALYWASRGNGLFFTYDNGRSWQQAPDPVSSGFIYSVTVHPADKCTLYSTNGARIFRSTDCTRSWTEVYRESTGDRIMTVAVNPFPPHQLYAGKSSGSILQSTDSGVSWHVMSSFRTPKILDIFTSPYEEGTLYVATQQKGLYRSKDGGSNWVSLTAGLEAFPGVNEYRRFLIYPTTPGLLFYVSTYGILRSTDGGDSWNPIELIHPPGSARIYGFAVNPKNAQEIYYTATIDSRSTLYKSVDGGQSWITERLPSGQIPTVLRIHPEDGWLYAGFTIPPQ